MTRIYDVNGRRKYLTPEERLEFLRAAERAAPAVCTFCETLAHSGCRISEGLALTGHRCDVDAGVLVFESLKKRKKGVYRAVPVPPDFLERLEEVHGLDELGEHRLWPWSRSTAWRRVKAVLEAAEIKGPHATPRGLRHGFGIKAVTSDIPLGVTQKWMGHANIASTAIYTNAVGPEEVRLAERMWS